MSREYLIKEIFERLSGNFEHDLFEASLHNLDDSFNKLRFNNFAYSIRELTRHILARLAPDKNVINTTWYKPTDTEHPDRITRKQRMRYAIQGGLSNEYVSSSLRIDVDEIGKKINDAIDILNKYTHINPKTFDIESNSIESMSIEVLESVVLLFRTIDECRVQLTTSLEEHIDRTIIDNLFYDTIGSIDYLATHYTVDSYSVDEIKLLDLDDSIVYFKASGLVDVKLQYGSDGDMRRGDGMTMSESFPFTGNFYGKIIDKMTKFELETETFEVDTDSHWGEKDIDEYIERMNEEDKE